VMNNVHREWTKKNTEQDKRGNIGLRRHGIQYHERVRDHHTVHELA
jgi:hypothetical protein